MDSEEWPTSWTSIRMTWKEFTRFADLLTDISEAAYGGKPYTLSDDDAFWLAGIHHHYLVEGHFQGEKWRQRLTVDGHTVDD